jgi:hypothetical protein
VEIWCIWAQIVAIYFKNRNWISKEIEKIYSDEDNYLSHNDTINFVIKFCMHVGHIIDYF